MARAARSEGAAEDFRGERAAMLATALAETQRAAETAASRLAKLALDGSRGDGSRGDGSRGDGGGDDARTVTASLRRRESAAAPGRHVAALVLFGRAARGALSLAAEELAKKKHDGVSSFSQPAGRAISGSDVVVDGLVSLADAKCHVGDAAEWLAAGSRAAALVAMDAAHRRALAGELQECRAALEKTRA